MYSSIYMYRMIALSFGSRPYPPPQVGRVIIETFLDYRSIDLLTSVMSLEAHRGGKESSVGDKKSSNDAPPAALLTASRGSASGDDGSAGDGSGGGMEDAERAVGDRNYESAQGDDYDDDDDDESGGPVETASAEYGAGRGEW